MFNFAIYQLLKSKKQGVPERQIIASFHKPDVAQSLYNERWQIESAFYGKQKIMQSGIIKFTHTVILEMVFCSLQKMLSFDIFCKVFHNR
jgi:hypothetical protein